MKRRMIEVLGLALTLTGVARAQGYDPVDGYHDVRATFARVVDVKRVGGRYSTRLDQECWNERTGRAEPGYYRDGSGRLYRGDSGSTAGTVIGAIIGGVLGNQVGDGSGRTVATVAGAAIGGAIGNRSGRDDAYDHEYDGFDRYRDESGVERRCRTVGEPTNGYGRRGYQVTYEYAGQVYRMFTTIRPGRTVPVTVDVRPR